MSIGEWLLLVPLLFPVLGAVLVLAVITGVTGAPEAVYERTPWGKEALKKQQQAFEKRQQASEKQQGEAEGPALHVSPRLYEELHNRMLLGFTPAELRVLPKDLLKGLDTALLDGLPPHRPITGAA